jgi:predicted regulator of Ras-like GTPase activity (Roadblock/LC7/MglB family)
MAKISGFEFDRFGGLSRATQLKLDEAIRELSVKTEASLLLLSDKSGRLVSIEGNVRELDPSVLSAVSASFFAALAEIGNLIGESRRSAYQYFEGDTYKIYLTFVSDDFFLTAVFQGRIPLGLVRTYCDQALKKIRTNLLEIELNAAEERSQEADEVAGVLNDGFARSLDDSMKDIFGDRDDEP